MFTRALNSLSCFLKVDHSVLDALPPELREQVEQAWNHKQVPDTSLHPTIPQQSFSVAPSVLLHLPDQPGQTGIILELPDFSQVVFNWLESGLFCLNRTILWNNTAWLVLYIGHFYLWPFPPTGWSRSFCSTTQGITGRATFCLQT